MLQRSMGALASPPAYATAMTCPQRGAVAALEHSPGSSSGTMQHHANLHVRDGVQSGVATRLGVDMVHIR